MGKRFRARPALITAPLAAIAVALVLASPVSAATGGGTADITSVSTTVFQLAGNEVVTKGTAVAQLTGTLDGTATFRFTATATQSGVSRWVMIGNCDCSASGSTGTVHVTLIFNMTADDRVLGSLYALGTSGDLSTFRGMFRLSNGEPILYSGFYSL